MQSKEPFGVSIKKTKYTKKGGQKGLFSQNPYRGFKGFQGSEVEKIKRREKEEETKPRRYRIATTIIPYVVFLFCVLRATVHYYKKQF